MLLYSSAAESLPLAVQEAEENFDLALVGALEIDVVPYIGDMRVPDSIITQLAKTLHQGSRLYETESGYGSPPLHSAPSSPPPSITKTGSKRSSNSRESKSTSHEINGAGEGSHHFGSTESGPLLPRERFSYWCFDLLFLICSDTTKGEFNSCSVLEIYVLNIYSYRSRRFKKEDGCTKLTIVTKSMSCHFGRICRR